MILFDSKKRVLSAVFLLLSISLGTGLLFHFRKPLLNKFQQSYRLNTDQIDSWQSFGGTWDVQHGVLHNNDDERGAKLMSGSTKWQNYTLQADLRFDGERGDIGLIIRSDNEEEGVDAYNGYYVGLRTMDGTLVIGRSAYGWSEAMPLLMPGGVHARIWYRLRITAVGCNLVASSENLTTGQKAWMAFTEHDCVLSGRIGIRSLGTGGTWTSVSVVPANETDYLAMAMHAGPAEQPEFPEREADFNRRIHLLPRANIPETNIGQVASDLHIGDLQNLSRMQMTNVVLRGVVTLTGPNLYVEDSSGGLVIQNPQGPPLNVGDGVQVSGPAEPTVYSAVIHNGTVRLISSGTPFPPFSVTPWQAASGAYDARFVELEGHLQNEVHVENGYQVLDLYEGGEAFRGLYADQVGGKLRDLRKNSLIRLRGVCVLGRSYTQDLIPFVLLLRSEDDIEVLAGPPWWTPWHVGMLFIGLLVFASLLQIMYFRIRQWKTNAITQERERLAHDIHDTMAQSFAGIGYQIQGIRTSVLRSEPDTPRQIADALGTAYQLVRKCHENASRTIAVLSSAATDNRSNLLVALTENVHKLAGERIRIVSETVGVPFVLNPKTSAALLQIGQEAISNAIEHGSPAVMTLNCLFERSSMTLMIADDGEGFDYDPLAPGFGIMGMHKRAHDVGATLEILSAPGAGTRLNVRVKQYRISSLLIYTINGAWKKLRYRSADKS